MSEKLHDFEIDPGTIEHILPENPSAEWNESFSKDRQNDFIYRLGNLTLLESGLNRQIGNAPFAMKLPVYKESNYQITQSFALQASEEWTAATLDARQEKMAKQAAHIWRSDFLS